MAPSSGLLVPMAMRIARHAIKRTSKLVRAKLAASSRPLESQLQSVLARTAPRQPIHPAALLRQSRSGWVRSANAAIRRFASSSGPSGVKYDKASFPASAIGAAVSRLPARAPFASTLRPNLTGGALSRTAGGYAFGSGRVGGARCFSHTPAAPAQVVNNVSLAVRALFLSGGKPQFDGAHPLTGEKRYKTIPPKERRASAVFEHLRAITLSGKNPQLNTTSLMPEYSSEEIMTPINEKESEKIMTPVTEDESNQILTPNSEGEQLGPLTLLEQDIINNYILSLCRAPGSFIDFERPADFPPAINQLCRISDIVEFISDPLSDPSSDPLSHDLAILRSDLVKLSARGDFECFQSGTNRLHVHFPGYDVGYLLALCHDLFIQRGIARQDPEFETSVETDNGLIMPAAPSHAGSTDADAAPRFDLTYDQFRRYATRMSWQSMLSSPKSPSSGFDHISTQSIMSILTSAEHVEEQVEEQFEDDVEEPVEEHIEQGYEHLQFPSPNQYGSISSSSPLSGYSSLHASEAEGSAYDPSAGFPYQQYQSLQPSTHQGRSPNDASQYEGIPGLLRFLQECDDASRRTQ